MREVIYNRSDPNQGLLARDDSNDGVKNDKPTLNELEVFNIFE